MKYNEIIKLNLSKKDVINALAKAKEQDFIDNLREGHVYIQFDSKLRGYVGEIALKKWFLENGIEIIYKLKGYAISWRFAKRRFWVCKLNDCCSPIS